MVQTIGLIFSYFMLQGALLLCMSGKDSKPNIVILLADDPSTCYMEKAIQGMHHLVRLYSNHRDLSSSANEQMLGYGDPGCYGHPYSITPNIDAMAKEGLRFTDFYSAGSICSPSRAALLTGRYQTRSGVYPGAFIPTSTGGLPRKEITIAEYVKQVGYSTAIVGKWHLGVGRGGDHLPTHQGFDYYLGIPYSHSDCPCTTCLYPNTSCYYNMCAPSFSPCPLYENTAIIEQPVNLLTLHDKYVKAATSFIRKETANGKPFLLYMAFQHTHHPQYAGDNFTNSSIRGRYGDALNELDCAVGNIITVLNETGVGKNTFAFFASDNGPALPLEVQGGNRGILKCGKGTSYEGGQRVPGIAWWPGIIKSGKSIEMASTLDVLPTILKLVGVEAMKGVTLDGYDMGPILFEGKKSLRDTFYYYHSLVTKEDGVFAMRYRQYKAHFLTRGTNIPSAYHAHGSDHDCNSDATKTVQDPPLLFDLHLDPSEEYTLTPDDPEYNQTMSIISKMKDQFNTEMVWGESQTDRGEDPSLMPCASPGCHPFPSCCHTSTVCPSLM